MQNRNRNIDSVVVMGLLIIIVVATVRLIWGVV